MKSAPRVVVGVAGASRHKVAPTGVRIRNKGLRVSVRWSEAEALIAATLDSLQTANIEWLRPVRVLKDHPKSSGRLTSQPVHSLGRAFLVESRQEAIRLIELDFGGRLEWLVPQPVAVSLGGGSPLVPDFLYKLRGAGVVLENVRAPHRRDSRFWQNNEVLRELALQLGWAYSVAGESVVEYGAVLERLSAYARVEPRRDVVLNVGAAFEERRTWRLGELIERCASGDVYAVSSFFALMWRRVLRFPLESGLSSRTVLTLGGSDA